MGSLPTQRGFELEECLVETPKRSLHLARRETDGAEVVLKGYPLCAPEARGPSAPRELEALRALRPGIAPQAHEVFQSEERDLLVLERLPGQTPRGPMELSPFLQVATRVAAGLSGIHSARLVHRNLAPQNLWADLASSEPRVWILGFSHAAPLGAPSQNQSGERALDGPLLYMAPEQTGRLERGVDFRSDLYALGASFYELLTGRTPFDACDPRDLIHAHLAQRARPPVEIRPEIPSTVSRIVTKLLEKEPEDRYQTAEAVQVDLETCLEQLQRTGRVDDELVLGTADAPYRPLFRQRVYGREEECAALQSAYRRSAEGAMALLLVSGAPGVGKSALIPELHRPLALDGGYLVRGKFDLYRGHLPYAGFASALRSLLRQIAAETEQRREDWRSAIAEGLGRLAGALGELVPELEALLGELPPVPTLEPRQARQRLALAARRFALAAARRARPLVLFLDDLQWADAGSRDLLEEILVCGEQAPLLMIGCYRDSEVPPEHPLRSLLGRVRQRGIAIDALALGPLSNAAACEMLADALGHEPEEARDLAARIEGLSGNNPLLIQQGIYHLHELDCIQYDYARGWSWDLSAAALASLPDDPVGMMMAKLQRLPAEARALVQLASCVGDEFDVDLLCQLSGQARTDLEASLYDLAEAGLIAPCTSGFRFVHDRIREAAQSGLPERKRAQLHYRTATLLLEQLGEEERRARCFEIADHLARCPDEIPEDRRLECIRIHRTAGLTALSGGAAAAAGHYLDAALKLFRERDWSEQPGLAFELYLRASDCAYLTSEFDRALQRLGPLEQRRFSPLQEGMVAAQRIRISVMTRPDGETMDLTLSAMRRFGRRIPRHPSALRVRWELARADWAMRGHPQTWPLDRVAGPSAVWVVPMLSHAAAGVTGRTSLRLGAILAADALRTLFAHGYRTAPAFVIAAYATSRSAYTRSGRRLRKYANAARYWLDRLPDAPGTAQAVHTTHAFPFAWTHSRHEGTEPLRRVSETLLELGDVEYSMYAAVFRAYYLGLAGAPLAEVIDGFEMLREGGQHRALSHLADPYRALREATPPELPLEAIAADVKGFRTVAPLASVQWALALSFLGRPETAWTVSEWTHEALFGGIWNGADHMLYRGLAAAALAPAASGLPARRMRRAVRESLRYLQHWGRRSPDFAHMAPLVRAEQLRARGRAERALCLYSSAARGAERCRHTHHAALALERCTALQLQLGREPEALESRSRARELYSAWGAPAKAAALREEP